MNWYRHGNQTIQSTPRIHVSTNLLRSVITFAQVFMEDNGTVQCVVSLEPAGAGNHDNFILPSKEVAAFLSLKVEGNNNNYYC